MKYIKDIILVIIVSILGTGMILFVNGDDILRHSNSIPSKVVMSDKVQNAIEVSQYKEPSALILYNPDDEISVKYKGNLELVLGYLRYAASSVDIRSSDSSDYINYDLVVIATSRMEEELSNNVARLLNYVEEGGRLFIGQLQESYGEEFHSIYRKLGICEYGEYIEAERIVFEKELLPGIRGVEFGGAEFADTSLGVSLSDQAEVYATTKNEDGKTPLIWKQKLGEGCVVVFNGTGITGDFWRGIIGGCIEALNDTAMYPVINAKCIFIDDFPSPQYENDSEILKKEYNRTVSEFYRDIWWPDMERAAKQKGDIYTGLFVATYNDIVNPEEFEVENNSLEQYYGKSLLKNGYELGAHGYNHQPLAGMGETPEKLHYKSWANEADMQASIEELVDISCDLFPGNRLKSYVPPSNYLSQEGREALKRALPDLKVISGVYTGEAEEGAVYAQTFEIAEDGIAEFPRVTSGMHMDDMTRFEYFNALGLHGVFSHFIHPDDLFDPDRSLGKNWETMYKSYCDMMNEVHVRFPWLRPLKASEAADALKMEEEVTLEYEIDGDTLVGRCGNFYGEAYFYLKTDKQVKSTDDSCEIQLSDPGNGELYYLVKVKKPVFNIGLKER